MKKIILSVLLLGIIMGLQAQELKVINLNKPDKSRNVTLMQALNKRHSERAFANKQLTHQDLSDLLWAANGINRPSEGKRTAPSANNVVSRTAFDDKNGLPKRQHDANYLTFHRFKSFRKCLKTKK